MPLGLVAEVCWLGPWWHSPKIGGGGGGSPSLDCVRRLPNPGSAPGPRPLPNPSPLTIRPSPSGVLRAQGCLSSATTPPTALGRTSGRAQKAAWAGRARDKPLATRFCVGRAAASNHFVLVGVEVPLSALGGAVGARARPLRLGQLCSSSRSRGHGGLAHFFRTPKPEISLSLPHVFGFGRCKEGIFQGNHGYFSRYGWYLCLRAQRPAVCSGCSAAPHRGLLSAGKSSHIRQSALSGARNRTTSIERQG